jgi:hypothetical protein
MQVDFGHFESAGGWDIPSDICRSSYSRSRTSHTAPGRYRDAVRFVNSAADTEFVQFPREALECLLTALALAAWLALITILSLQPHHITDLYCLIDNLVPSVSSSDVGCPILLADVELVTILL